MCKLAGIARERIDYTARCSFSLENLSRERQREK